MTEEIPFNLPFKIYGTPFKINPNITCNNSNINATLIFNHFAKKHNSILWFNETYLHSAEFFEIYEIILNEYEVLFFSEILLLVYNNSALW